MKRKMITVITIIFVLSAVFLVGTGFQKRTDVVLIDYSVSEDGTAIELEVQVASSMGYIRGFKNNGGGVKPHYLTFYSTFGGVNSSFGAVNSVMLEIAPDDTEIYFNRAGGGYELVLVKDEKTGQWVRTNSPEKLEINKVFLTEEFWERVTKVVFYDFNEDIYELSDKNKFEELQDIFKEMTYKEIENPWLEGWYLFEIYTDEKIYKMRITGKTINFDGTFYKVTDSIAEEVTEIIKSE